MQYTCLERQLDHQDFNSEILHIYLPHFQQITFLLIVAKAGNNCCKLSLEVIAQDDKEEMTASLATAKEANVGSAIGSVISEVDCILTLKDKQRRSLEAFFSTEQHIFTLIPSGFGRSLVAAHCDSLQGSDVRLISPLSSVRSFELLLPG